MSQQQVCIGGFIQNSKGEILFVKRAEDDDFLPGMWELPGGGTDYGETPQEAIRREVQEECGLDVTVTMPLGVHCYNMEDIQRVEITFLCALIDEKQPLVLSNEHSDYRWVSQEELTMVQLSEYMQQVVSDALANPIIQKL